MTHRILLSGKKKRHGMEPAEDAGEMEKKERYHLLDGLRGDHTDQYDSVPRYV